MGCNRECVLISSLLTFPVYISAAATLISSVYLIHGVTWSLTYDLCADRLRRAGLGFGSVGAPWRERRKPWTPSHQGGRRGGYRQGLDRGVLVS